MKSMTAYGRATENIDGKDITVEIKSVNNRYLDCNVKVPKLYGFLEEKIKSYVQSGIISRGKVEIYLSVNETESNGTTIALDEAYLKSYLAALHRLRDEYSLRDDISVMRIAQNFNVFSVKQAEEDTEREWVNVKKVLDSAIEEFRFMREHEGENLKRDLLEKKANLVELREKVAALAGEATEAYRARLENRLRQVLEERGLNGIDEARIVTECALFADKTAIDEELVRLNSHFDSFDKALMSDEPIGRRVDFILQEMNREVNTIGSKANNIDITNLVVDMKSELEKIREQIQNVE